MDCLWCNKQIIQEISWENIFMLPKPQLLCKECVGHLAFIQDNRCNQCSRISEETICADCRQWSEYSLSDSIVFNHSIFSYNPFMKDIVAKWKYRGDYVLGTVFKQAFIRGYKEKFSFLKKDAVIVPIPLSEERSKERGFNQAKMLADFLPMKSKAIITRVHGEKQSKKTRSERIFAENPFLVTEIIHKPVILVDDIYTTGATLRHAGSLLKAHGCPKVYAFTLIRG